MTGDDVTLGELSRRLSDVAARLEQTAGTFDLTYVRRDLYQRDSDEFRRDLALPYQTWQNFSVPVVVAGLTAGSSYTLDLVGRNTNTDGSAVTIGTGVAALSNQGPCTLEAWAA